MIGAKTGIFASVGGFDPAYEAIVNYAQAQGHLLPSGACIEAQNPLAKGIREASTNGMSSWKLLRNLHNDINHGGTIPTDLGFDGINWASPGVYVPEKVDTLTKIQKQGYHGNGTSGRVKEGINFNTAGLATDDFLWMTVYYFNNVDPTVGLSEGVFDSTFNKRIDTFFVPNDASASTQILFGVNTGGQTYASANNLPAYQRFIMWRASGDLYVMFNGTQYGPFSVGADTGLMDQEFNSFVRSYQTNNFFEYMGDNIRKSIFGFGKASEIDKAALDAALATYIATSY
jgi:hypothetical protein